MLSDLQEFRKKAERGVIVLYPGVIENPPIGIYPYMRCFFCKSISLRMLNERMIKPDTDTVLYRFECRNCGGKFWH